MMLPAFVSQAHLLLKVMTAAFLIGYYLQPNKHKTGRGTQSRKPPLLPAKVDLDRP